MNAYKKLVVWQKADELADRVYQTTKYFPENERFGLTSQLRRAALSIPVNLVEGVGRQSRAELKRFASISLGSFAETEYLIHFCNKQHLFRDSDYQILSGLIEDVGSLLWRFFRSF